MAFATFDPSNKHSSVTLSGGDRTATAGGAGGGIVHSTATTRTSGQWYVEFTVVEVGGGGTQYGVGTSSVSVAATTLSEQAGGLAYTSSGLIRGNSTTLQSGLGGVSNGDVIGIEYDADADTLKFFRNGVQLGTTITSYTADVRPMISLQVGSSSTSINSGQDAWAHEPPAGFEGWDDGAPTPNDGTADVTLQALTAFADGPALGQAAFQPLTAAAAGAAYGAGVLAPLTASAGGSAAPFAEGTLAVLTAEAVGQAGGVGAAALTLEFLSAAASDPGSFDGVGDARLARLSALAYEPDFALGALRRLTASATGLNGGVGTGAARLHQLVVAASSEAGGIGTGSPAFVLLRAQAAGVAQGIGSGSADLRALRAEVRGLTGGIGSGAPSFLPLLATASGHSPTVGIGTITLALPYASAEGHQAVESTFRGWATNSRSGAVTEYTAFPYNSLARYNGVYLAAGADGIFLLAGDDDDGVPIAWDIRTGQHDDKRPELKRLTEALMGLRADGAVRVTVWKDDQESYEYVCPIYRDDVIHQVRAPIGRGLRSRYFQVGLSGSGVAVELDSLQMTMPSTSRRLG